MKPFLPRMPTATSAGLLRDVAAGNVVTVVHWTRGAMYEARPARVARGTSMLANAEGLGDALRCGAAMQRVERRI